MLAEETINQLLNIKESYQAPQRMLDFMLSDKERPKLFDAFLEHETDLSQEWFHGYFEDEHSDRKKKKQDFTPKSVSKLLAAIVNDGKIYNEPAAGTGGIMIQTWHEHRVKAGPGKFDPRSYWYQTEEMSARAIPFLIFNMAIRGMNGMVMHGDSLTRDFENVYFIRNDSSDFLAYSEVIQMERTDDLKKELHIYNWVN